MKPITYWIQNDAINELVAKYGAYLEALTLDVRRELISVLAVADKWTWAISTSNLTDSLVPIYPLIESLTRYEKDLLIEAIAATLTHQGNPWLENARQNVAIAQAHAPQKTGTPTVE